MHQWTPKDIHKTVVQLFGIVLGIGGIKLVDTGARIEGTIIKFEFSTLSSELNTSNVGIILLFLGVILVITPAIIIKLDFSEQINKVKFSNKFWRHILPFLRLMFFFAFSFLIFKLPQWTTLPPIVTILFTIIGAGGMFFSVIWSWNTFESLYLKNTKEISKEEDSNRRAQNENEKE